MSDEVWKAVPEFEGRYEVSDQGRVRSLPHIMVRSNGWPLTVKGQMLAYNLDGAGRPSVRIGGKMRHVHRVVMLTFVGPLPKGLVTRHLNGQPDDCRLENMVYGTRQENAWDRIAHGGDPNARKTHCRHNHAFDELNTGRDRRGHRVCRACNRERARAAYQSRVAS